MKLNVKKDNLKSAVFITLSLILMAGSLYVGLVKGRIDDQGDSAKLDEPSYGIEDLVIGDDMDNPDNADIPGEIIVNSDEADEVYEDNENQQTVKDVEKSDVVSSNVMKISLSCPVRNDKIVMDYSFDTSPVYSKTFGEYRSDHTGVDYSAKKDEEVFAAAEGTVKDIYEDEKLGITVTVSHEGFETKYSNLQRGVFVSVGEKVDEKTALGRVGDTAVYESGEDSHVHFSLYVDGKCVDPKNYMEK